MLSATDLLNSKEPQKVEVALKTAEPLVRSQPADLREVSACMLHVNVVWLATCLFTRCLVWMEHSSTFFECTFRSSGDFRCHGNFIEGNESVFSVQCSLQCLAKSFDRFIWTDNSETTIVMVEQLYSGHHWGDENFGLWMILYRKEPDIRSVKNVLISRMPPMQSSTVLVIVKVLAIHTMCLPSC